MKQRRFVLLFALFALPLAGATPDDEVWSKTIDGYPVHIFADPAGEKDPVKRSVLVLGTFSDSKDSIADARKLVNPSTGRPYDVIVGVGYTGNPSGLKGAWQERSEILKEGRRVILEDHWNADRNAAAVKKGIEERFGAPLAAATVDMHSNGTPVGMTAIEQGAIRDVRQLHLMGPDIGYAGKYVAEERINKMKDLGIQEVHIHRTKGDIIHGLGNMSAGIVEGAKPLSVTIAQKARDLVVQTMRLSTADGKPDSIIRNHEYEMAEKSGDPFDPHYAKRYVALRAEASRDRELIQKTRERMGTADYDHAAGVPFDPNAKTVHIYNGRNLDDVLREGTPKQNAALLRELEEAADNAGTLRQRDGLLLMRDYAAARVWSGVGADDAKGVRIHFDERLLAEVLEKGSPEENARLLNDLGRRLADARTTRQRSDVLAAFETEIKQRFRASGNLRRLGDLAAVSLKKLLADAEPYATKWNELPDNLRRPGGLTRLHGFVVAGDDILILGRREEGAPPLEIDDLIVGIRAAWKEHETPLVSLDPDPENMEGDPRTRIQGIPGDSGFALTLLEADYAMKKIMGGVRPVDVPGYRTLKELLRDTTQAFISRFWLYPVQPGAGDIQIASDASSALFCGGVQVLSEEMMLLKEGLVGTNRTFGPAEEASRSFTNHYAAIAAQEPVFRRLEGLFDVVLLGRVWRNRGLKSPLLDRLCALPHRTVVVPATYPAIRVLVRRDGDMEYYIYGGVQAKIGAGRQTWLPFDDDNLRALRDRCAKISASGVVAAGVTDVALEVALPSTRPDESSRTYSAAVVALLKGELDAAVAAANKLAEADPWDPEVFTLRALIHLRRADYGRARRDALRARELAPDAPETIAATTEILFQCRWIEGDPEGALREMEWSLQREADGAHAHVARGEALAMLDKPDQARKEYEKAVALDPGSAVACAALAMLELGEGKTLAAKPWIAKARALQPDLPEVLIASAYWELAIVRPDNAEKIATKVWENGAAGPTERLQALAILASVAAAREKWDRVDEYIALMERMSVGSPEVLVVAAEIAWTWGERARARRYAAKAETLAPKHPLILKLRQKVK